MKPTIPKPLASDLIQAFLERGIGLWIQRFHPQSLLVLRVPGGDLLIGIRLSPSGELSLATNGLSAEREEIVRNRVRNIGVSEDRALALLNLRPGELREAILTDGTLPPPLRFEGATLHLHESIRGYLEWRRQTASDTRTRKQRESAR